MERQPALNASVRVVTAVAALGAAACGPINVERSVLLQCRAPGGQRDAVFWVETSGVMAVGDVTYHLSIVPASRSPDWLQSSDLPDDLLVLRRGRDVRLRWQSPADLDVEFPDTAAVIVGPVAATVQQDGSMLNLRYRPVTTPGNGELVGGSACLQPTQ